MIKVNKDTYIICINHLFNKCILSKCIYKHIDGKKCILNLNNLTNISTLEVCKYNLLGFCESINCKNIHCKHNIPTFCIKYTKYGECNIINCTRIHEKKIDMICSFYSRGDCKQGINCGFNHINKTKKSFRNMLTEKSSDILPKKSFNILTEKSSDILPKKSFNILTEKPSKNMLTEKSFNILTEKPSKNMLTEKSFDILPKKSFNILTEIPSNILPEKLNILSKNYKYNKIKNNINIDIIINIKYTFFHFENKNKNNSNSKKRSLSVPYNFRY